MLRAALLLAGLLFGGLERGLAARKVVKRHAHTAPHVAAESPPAAAPQKNLNASRLPTALLHQATTGLPHTTGVTGVEPGALERGRSSRWTAAMLQRRQQVAQKWTASLTWNHIVALLLGCGIFVVGLACGVLTTFTYFRLILGGHAGNNYKPIGSSSTLRPMHRADLMATSSSNDRFIANDLMDMTVLGSTADVSLANSARLGVTGSARVGMTTSDEVLEDGVDGTSSARHEDR